MAASLMGFHDNDAELADLSEEAIEGHTSALRSVVADAEAIDSATLDQKDQITRDLAIHQAEVTSQAYEGRYLLGAVDTYTGGATGLLLGISSLSATNAEQSQAYADRWQEVPRFLDQVLQLNRAEIARDRPPARIVTERVINMIDGYLDTAIEDDLFVKATLHDGASDAQRDEVTQIASEVIRPAYAAYRNALTDEVVPIAKQNDRVGLTYNSDGDAVYEKLIHMYTSLPAEPQELHDYGLADATEHLPDEWSEVGERALGISDISTLFDRLRNDPELSYESADEMVDHARTTVERGWAAIDGWFGARPESPCDVVEVPQAIAKDLPPAYYMTPSSDGSRPGQYFLNTHDPPSRKRFNYESIHFHEAIPGHHFDRSLSMELENIPEFRKRFPAFAMAEGWGLYSERLANEMGLYSSDMDRLGMLSADAWRAGRLVVDTGMHYMGWSRQRAIDWFVEWTPIPLPVIEQEVDRYIGMPGQALSYKVGQREIFRLRAGAEKTLGDRFVIADFHDAVLTSGGMTLPLLGRVVEDWAQGRAT